MRQRLARDAAHFRRCLRDGATSMQKTFRMYVVRKWFLHQKYNATIIQSRFIRRRLAQDRCDRLREERDRAARVLRDIQDNAITKVQTVARSWLAYRAVDRLREKYDDTMEALESASGRFDGDWCKENGLTRIFIWNTQHLMYTVKEVSDAARNFRAGIGRLGRVHCSCTDTQFYSLCESETQNDVAEAVRRQKSALKLDPLRKSARRLELLFDCMIKMDGLNPMVLEAILCSIKFFAIIQQQLTTFSAQSKLIHIRTKLWLRLRTKQLETRKRAIVRGEVRHLGLQRGTLIEELDGRSRARCTIQHRWRCILKKGEC